MTKNGTILCFLLLSGIYILDLGCAGKQISKVADSGGDVGKDFAEKNAVTLMKEEQEQITEEDIYDIETEMPENRDLEDEEEIEEKMDSAESDSFYVEDITREGVTKKDYSLGYRVQIFASGNLEKAKEIKKQTEREISLKVYIEFDEGMYKVRVGNFNSRAEAAETRRTLTSLFPDCWIAETTIRN